MAGSSTDMSKATEAERAPLPARALVIDGDAQQSKGITRALRAAISEVDLCPSPTDVIDSGQWDLIALNFDGLDAAARDAALQRFAQHNARRRLIVYASGYSSHGLAQLLGQHGIGHTLSCSTPEDLNRLRVTACKSLDDDIFGLDKYLAWGALTTTIRVTRSAQRAEVLEACAQIAERVGMRERRAESLATLADELLTNALYNAPTDLTGNHRFLRLDRRIDVELDPGEIIHVTLGSDSDNVGVSVSDPFGSVTSEHLVGSLGRCLTDEQMQPRRDQGGAGLGLFHAYQASSQLAFNIAPGLRTEAIGILDIASSNKEFKARPKSLTMFQSTACELKPGL